MTRGSKGRSSRRQRRKLRKFILFGILLLASAPSLLSLRLATKTKDTIDRTTTTSIDKPLPTSDSLQCDEGQPCCAPWSSNTDSWWTHHPSFVVGADNDTHTCFRKIDRSDHHAFVEQLYELQWKTGDCSKSIQKSQISSGYAAALMATARSFYAAFNENRPFQISKHRADANWNFSPRNHSHWAYCKAMDMNCYFLPIGKCPAVVGRDNGVRGIKPSSTNEKQRFLWLRQYAFRPRHMLRYKLHEFMKDRLPEIPESCAAVLHVRRSDISFGKGRRYAAVHEYLVAGSVPKGSAVVILTDDQSTIDEINRYLKDSWRFIYLERPRFQGSEGGFEGFIPSTDPAFEVLSIQAELKLASNCRKLVHGKSGFVDVIEEAMQLSGNAFESIYLQTQQDKGSQPKMDPKDRAESYLRSIDEYYAKVGHL